MIKAIACVDENWGIGKDNNLLFFLPSDLIHFKRTTLNSTVLMGRNTFESLPFKSPLTKRNNIIVTTDPSFFIKGATVVNSLEQGIKEMQGEGFIIGGASIYNQALKYCDECIITKVYSNAEADRYFPNLDKMNNWEIKEKTDIVEENGLKYNIITYKRVE